MLFCPLFTVVFRPLGASGGENRRGPTGGCPKRMFEKLKYPEPDALLL